MSANSRLQAMLFSRRPSSDITIPTSVSESSSSSHVGEAEGSTIPTSVSESSSSSHVGEAEGSTRVKVRMTKAQLAQLMAESNNSSETAEKILDFFLHDGEAQKNATTTENITEEPSLENISNALKKAL